MVNLLKSNKKKTYPKLIADFFMYIDNIYKCKKVKVHLRIYTDPLTNQNSSAILRLYQG